MYLDWSQMSYDVFIRPDITITLIKDELFSEKQIVSHNIFHSAKVKVHLMCQANPHKMKL